MGLIYYEIHQYSHELKIEGQYLDIDMLKKLNKEDNQTFLIVTHNTEVADACKKKIRLQDGKNA